MLHPERQFIAQHQRVFDYVGEFAHIPRPLMARQHGKHRGLNHLRLRRRLRPEPAHQMAHKAGQIVGPLAQRRNGNLKGVDAEEQILAKRARSHHLLQRPMGGTHNPHIDGDGVVVTHSADFATFQCPQQPRLERLGEFADLVQKQRAAIGHLKQPSPMFLGAGEGPLAMAEKFAFHQMLRQRPAVHRHQRPTRPRAPLMDRPRHQFLACAGFPPHQDI